MAFELHRHGHQLSITAPSTLNPRTPVVLGGTSGLLALKAGSNNVRPFGVTGAGTALAGEAVTVYEDTNIVKVIAAASVGAGAEVGVASDNGAVGPVAQASGTLRWALGLTVADAGAGEVLSVYVRPRAVGGNA